MQLIRRRDIPGYVSVIVTATLMFFVLLGGLVHFHDGKMN